MDFVYSFVYDNTPLKVEGVCQSLFKTFKGIIDKLTIGTISKIAVAVSNSIRPVCWNRYFMAFQN